ncbi:hypothetical protein IKW73_03210 [Candidatus Saccharibacteria bacterium]|nr:hypothetical protein [Candidatus Saccharibacteria bacterium]
MITKKPLKIRLVNAIFGCLFGILGLILPIFASSNAAYAVPDNTDTAVEETTVEKTTTEEEEPKVETKTCDDSLGSLGWLVCPTTGKISEAVDWLYAKNKDLLEVNPVVASEESPIYQIWKYCLGVANIAFIIFLLVAVYSQITGVGISNYGIKKVLPKLIVAAIMVNLSFLICSLAVDASNIIGNGARGIFTAVEESTVPDMLSVEHYSDVETSVAMTKLYTSLSDGTTLAVGAGTVAFEGGEIWMLIPAALAALVAVVAGLITIALRQVVVTLLIMIAPLAIVAYILPNTESLFRKWKDLLVKMLVFYPMYSLLFGASSLAGWAIIASSSDGFGMILGTIVKILPLFFSWSLMKMSGTFLGTVNAKITGLFAAPLATNRAWAESHKAQTLANTMANGITPSARLRQYLESRRMLRETDTKNALDIVSGRANIYTQRKIADSEIGDTKSRSSRTSRYSRNAKAARNYSLMSQNASSHTDHVLDHYSEYFTNDARDAALGEQSVNAWLDYGRAAYQKEMDEEDDINFLVDQYLYADERDENNNPLRPETFRRYIQSVAGPNGEQRLNAKVIAQAARVENKQRSEYFTWLAKYGHNGFNKQEFRSWAAGYKVNDDGWAVDKNGKRLKALDANGNVLLDEKGKEVNLELVQGEALLKAPERLTLYDKRDENGLYFDFKDQNGKIIARLHRGLGADGKNHDDAAFMKEVLSNYDIPIADPINNLYSILAGVKPGSIPTPAPNDIGLSRYSTTIGRAMKDYKGNAAWAGSMFNSGIGNRQITSSTGHALWVLDSIVKTLKPGSFNTQNPASVEYLTDVLNPKNWDRIFPEEELKNDKNINNKIFAAGENWVYNERGKLVYDDDGEIKYEPVKDREPTYEERMNTVKRKLLFPAMKKVLPAFDRLRTSNTADNQKPGTADRQYEFLEMVKREWINNPDIAFDPLLVDQDLQTASKEFRQQKHDKNGRLIYVDDRGGHNRSNERRGNLLSELEDAYDRSSTPEELKHRIFEILNGDDRYARALQRFEDQCNEFPNADLPEIKGWFEDLDILVR